MPLSSDASQLAHATRDLLLVWLSLAFLPFTSITFACLYLRSRLLPQYAPAPIQTTQSTGASGRKSVKVLVTGVGMAKGLTVARLLHQAGHRVIGADFEPDHLPTCSGRVSRAVHKFYKLRIPGSSGSSYVQDLANIIKDESIDLWISCSGVMTAVEDGEAADVVRRLTSCKTIQFNADMIQKLHEKDAFMQYAQSIGLAIPETHHVTCHDDAVNLLASSEATKKKFIMKFVGVDDTVRANMTLLPLESRTLTAQYIRGLPISKSRPWILQEYIRGPEFCTHTVVVNNQVKAFVACPSAELLMHYHALPQDSSLSRSMLRWTQRFIERCPENFTGHLSFDFIVRQEDINACQEFGKEDIPLFPIECNPRAHTAVVLFNDTPDIVTKGYMSVFDHDARAPGAVPTKQSEMPDNEPVFPRHWERRYYWLPHDLVDLFLLPLIGAIQNPLASSRRLSKSVSEFASHVAIWYDGTFAAWDPLPAWWLWHVSWPLLMIKAMINGEKWSRVNVSTMKIFRC